ncbi:hypothetical protein MRX96_054603 [Rhipicephalus microplus]
MLLHKSSSYACQCEAFAYSKRERGVGRVEMWERDEAPLLISASNRVAAHFIPPRSRVPPPRRVTHFPPRPGPLSPPGYAPRTGTAAQDIREYRQPERLALPPAAGVRGRTRGANSELLARARSTLFQNKQG